MLKPETAWERIAAELVPLEVESVPRATALGRVLAEPVAAAVDVPPVDVSAMDGVAVAGSMRPGERLPISATIAAGSTPNAVLAPGSAARIMTGAPLPTGADRVVPVEALELVGDAVLFREADEGEGAHVRRRGEVVRQGGPVLERGDVITPGGLGLLATHGVRAVAAHRRPSVAFATTGDEVVAPEREPAPGQIRDSHSDFFRGACARLGLEARSLGIVPDRPEALRETIALGIAEHDVLLLSGGVSMGAFDLVEGVLAELGCRVLLDAVAIQPGKPMVAARHARGWVFALPGNPASAMVTFWLFVRPALRRLMGASDGYWHGALEAVLGRDLPGAKGRDLFLPGRARFGSAGQLEAWPLLPKGSHDVAAYGVGSLLIRVPARSEPTPAGERCSVLPLVEWLEH